MYHTTYTLPTRAMPPADPLTTTTTTTTARIATLSPAAAESPALLTLGQTALVWLVAVLFFIFIFLAALLASCAHSHRETHCSRDRYRRRRRRRFRQASSEMSCSCCKGSERLTCDGLAGHCDQLLSDDDETTECVHAVRGGGDRWGMLQQPHYHQEPSRPYGGHPAASCAGGGSQVLALVHPAPGSEVPNRRKKRNRFGRALLPRNGDAGGNSNDSGGSGSSCTGGAGGGRRGAYAQRLPPEWDEFQLELAAGNEENAWPYVMPPAPPPSRAGSQENLLPL